MPAVSLPAFLKIVSKGAPQKAQEYGRYLQPGGYDFYWRLKDAIHARTLGGEAFSDCSKAILEISRDVEKKHNLSGLKSFESWLNKIQAKEFFTPPLGSGVSARGHLTVKLEPEFGYIVNGRRAIVQTWNSKSVTLPKNVVGCGLYLMKEHLCVGEFSDCIPAILDLRRKFLFSAEGIPPVVISMVNSEFAWADGFFGSQQRDNRVA